MDWGTLKRSVYDRMPLFYVFMSGIGFSLQSLIIKKLAESGFHGSLHLVFMRGCCQLGIASMFIFAAHRQQQQHSFSPLVQHSGDDVEAIPVDTSVATPGNEPKESPVRLFGSNSFTRWMLFLRSSLGFGSIALAFLSAEYIAIGDATVLMMLSPMIASIAAALLLKESWRTPELVATLLSVVGAVLVAKPAFLFGAQHGSHFPTHGSDGGDASTSQSSLNDEETRRNAALGVTCGIVSAFFAGGAYICVRILGTSAKMPWPNVCFAQALGQILFSPPSILIIGQSFSQLTTITPVQWALIFTGGFLGSWSQIAMTVGMQREKSATATAMRMSDVVFGFIWQVCFTNDAANGLSVLGALLVSSSILVVVLFKPSATSGPGDGSSSSSSSTSQKNPMIELPAWDSSAHAMLHGDRFTIVDSDDEDDYHDVKTSLPSNAVSQSIVGGSQTYSVVLQSSPDRHMRTESVDETLARIGSDDAASQHSSPGELYRSIRNAFHDDNDENR